MKKLFCELLVLAFAMTCGTAFAQYSSPVRDVENPAQNPFMAYGYDSSNQGITNFFVALDPLVPANKRLAIDLVTVSCTSSSTDDIFKAFLWIYKKEPSGYSGQGMPVPIIRQGTTYDGKVTWTTAQPMRLYHDGSTGQKLYLDVYHKNYSEASGSCTCVAKVVGGTVNAQ